MKLHVITDIKGDDEVIDEFDGTSVSFMTEPSGVLMVFEKSSLPWAAYAPGSWRGVRRVRED